MSRRDIALPVAEIVRRYVEGESTPALGCDYGVDDTTIARRLRLAGITLRPCGGHNEVALPIEALLARYEEGESSQDLSQAYGVSLGTIRNRLLGAGVKMRPRGKPVGRHRPCGPLSLKTDGYFVTVGRNGKQCLLHRGCWEAHHGPIPNGHIVHHKDGNKENNSIGNLACMSHGDHSRLHKTCDKADRNRALMVWVDRREKCLLLMRRANMTNAMLADRCGTVASRKATHQMVSELLRPHNRRANMSARVRAALLAKCESILLEVE